MLKRSLLTLSHRLFRNRQVLARFNSDFKDFTETMEDQLENESIIARLEAEAIEKKREHTELELSMNLTPIEFEEIKKELSEHTAVENLRAISVSLQEIKKENDFETENRINHLLLEALVVLQQIDSKNLKLIASDIWESTYALLEQYKKFLKRSHPKYFNFSYFTLSFLRFYLLSNGIESNFELATLFKNLLTIHVQNMDFIDYSQLISIADEIRELNAENNLFVNLLSQTQIEWHLRGTIDNFFEHFKTLQKSTIETINETELLKIGIHLHQNSEFPPIKYVIKPQENCVSVAEITLGWDKQQNKTKMMQIAKLYGFVLSALSALKAASQPTKFHNYIVALNLDIAKFINSLKSDCKEVLFQSPSLMLRFAATLSSLNKISQLNNNNDIEIEIQKMFEVTSQKMLDMKLSDLYLQLCTYYQMFESRTTVDRRILQLQLDSIAAFQQSFLNTWSARKNLSDFDFKVMTQIMILLVSNKHELPASGSFNREGIKRICTILKPLYQEIEIESCYRLLLNLIPKNEFLIFKECKVPPLQELIARLVERVMTSKMPLTQSEYLKIASAYMLCEAYCQSSVIQEFISQYSKVETLDQAMDAFTFWRVFMIYSSEGQVMHQAGNLKRLQMSLKTQEIVSKFLAENKNKINKITTVIQKLWKLHFDCRFNVPNSQKNSLFRLKSTKRHVERIIYDFGEMTIENPNSPFYGLLNDDLDAVLELTRTITVITSTYNLLCSRAILDNVYNVWQKRKNEFTMNHIDLFLGTFFDSTVMPSMRPYMISIVQWTLDIITENAQSESLFMSKFGRNDYSLTKVLRFIFPEVNYQPAMMAMVELFLKEKIRKKDTLLSTCLRFLMYFIEGNKAVVQSLLPRVFFYVDQLIASDLMEKNRNKMIRIAYIYLLAARAYHPEFAAAVKPTVDKIEETFNRSKEYRQFAGVKVTWESNSQLQTELLLKRNDIPFEKEKLIAITRVDFFIPPSIVLEVLGESHFFNKELDAYSKIKRKIFISIGYRTLYVTDAFLKTFENKAKLLHSINKIRLEQLEARGMKVDPELRQAVAKGQMAKAESEREAEEEAKRKAKSQQEETDKSEQEKQKAVKLGKSKLFSHP